MNSVEHRSDTKSRTIEASPARVWAAMSVPERLARWWGPEGFSSRFEVFDFRPGGRWVFEMIGPDGEVYPNESVFSAIAPERHIVIRHACQPHFTLTVTLSPVGSDTLLRGEQVSMTHRWRRRFGTSSSPPTSRTSTGSKPS